jgi:LAO/AO transport system kinase
VEATGYDVVLVETVGVGQSETAVADMVDTFLLLVMARSGDQLQGIKKGILELADLIAVNKSDGPHEAECRRTAGELAGALRLLWSNDSARQPPVLICSARDNTGLDALWHQVVAHQDTLTSDGTFAAKRRRQQVDWTWATVRAQLLDELHEHPRVLRLAPALERQVLGGTLTPTLAAEQILDAFRTPVAGDRSGSPPGENPPARHAG